MAPRYCPELFSSPCSVLCYCVLLALACLSSLCPIFTVLGFTFNSRSSSGVDDPLGWVPFSGPALLHVPLLCLLICCLSASLTLGKNLRVLLEANYMIMVTPFVHHMPQFPLSRMRVYAYGPSSFGIKFLSFQ